MSAKHTPAPWTLRNAKHCGDVAILSEGQYILAECYEDIRKDDEHATAEAQANARLIAASPLLLQACKTFAEWLDREDAGSGTDRSTPAGERQWREWYERNMELCALAQQQARAAIAAAEGSNE